MVLMPALISDRRHRRTGHQVTLIPLNCPKALIQRDGALGKKMTGGSDALSLPDLAAVREVQLTSKQLLVHQTKT